MLNLDVYAHTFLFTLLQCVVCDLLEYMQVTSNDEIQVVLKTDIQVSAKQRHLCCLPWDYSVNVVESIQQPTSSTTPTPLGRGALEALEKTSQDEFQGGG